MWFLFIGEGPGSGEQFLQNTGPIVPRYGFVKSSVHTKLLKISILNTNFYVESIGPSNPGPPTLDDLPTYGVTT